MVAIHILSKEEITRAKTIWKQLETNINEPRLTSLWEWVETWITVYGALVDYWFFVGMQGDEPAGIALITKEIHRPLPFPVKAYHIGTYGEPYEHRIQQTNNTILAKEHIKAEFIHAVIDTLLKTFAVEELRFDEHDAQESEVILTILRNLKHAIAVDKEPMLFFDLDVARKDGRPIIEHFSPSMRSAIRRSLKAFPDLTVEWAQDSSHALDIFDELVVLYQATWEKLGRDGVFSSKYYTQFQRTLIQKLIDRKSVILFRVRSKQYGTVGCFYMVVDNGIGYFTQLGLKDFSAVTIEGINHNRLKTGYIMHALCMEECLKRGLKGYNFSTGIYPYKQQLTNASGKVITVSVRKSIKPVLRDTILHMYAKLDSSKTSPLLLRLIRTVIKR